MRSLVLAALTLAVMPAAALAQDTDVGGNVPSMLELTLNDLSLGRLPRQLRQRGLSGSQLFAELGRCMGGIELLRGERPHPFSPG